MCDLCGLCEMWLRHHQLALKSLRDDVNARALHNAAGRSMPRKSDCVSRYLLSDLDHTILLFLLRLLQ